ncbi:MAG: hypothetical protein IJK42_06555 [Prevotella sp.]|nr:hypothetical protein [Prevotella sp.]
MKKYILLLALTLSLNVVGASAQTGPSQTVTNALQTAREKAEQALEAAEKAQELADRLEEVADSMEGALEAFSDTTETAVENGFDDEDYEEHFSYVSDDIDWNPDHYDSPWAWLLAITASTFGIIVVIIVLMLVLLFLLLPFIILALILRLIIKRHNDRVTLAEKAMESGQPIPESLQGIDKQSNDYLWKRGIRNAAIGMGLMLMFWIWDANTLVGIGALVLCYGVGQMIMSKSSNRS